MFCESAANQTIHMKCQDLFSLKNKLKKSKTSSAVVVIGALRIKIDFKCLFEVRDTWPVLSG